MERKIGEIFEYNGEWYQCKKSDPAVNADGIMDCCEGCSMTASECADFNCSDYERLDKTQVIFKKLKKVGEPYSDYCPTGRIIYFQRYRCYQKPIIEGNIIWHWADDTLIDIDIEIKQNKEDMEEKKVIIGELAYKYINGKITYEAFEKGIKELCDNKEESKPTLKEFDLEAARSGKPVCTRDGRKARIICFDYDGETGDYPIVALVSYDRGNNCYERVLKYTSDGLFNKYGDYKHDEDLMMLPEKKEGWVNIYRDIDNNTPYTENDNIYSSRDKAKESAKMLNMKTYIDTIKVEWEE